MPATLITAAVALVLIFTGTFEKLLAMFGIVVVVLYCSAFLAIFVLRRTRPELKRPFRVPGYPWTPAIVLSVSAAFLIGILVQDTRNSLYGFGLISLSLPVFWLIRRNRSFEQSPQ